jgi:hypothetical protein
MSEAAKTARIIEDEVARVVGGKRTSDGRISIPLAEGYTGRVSLSRATMGRPKGWIGVWPIVGVRD